MGDCCTFLFAAGAPTSPALAEADEAGEAGVKTCRIAATLRGSPVYLSTRDNSRAGAVQ